MFEGLIFLNMFIVDFECNVTFKMWMQLGFLRTFSKYLNWDLDTCWSYFLNMFVVDFECNVTFKKVDAT